MENSVTLSTELVRMGVRLGITNHAVKKNALQTYSKETVCKTAVRIAIEKPVTEKPVHANEVVLQDGNHLCVIKNVMTEHLGEIAVAYVGIANMWQHATKRPGNVHLDVNQGTKGSTAKENVKLCTTDLIAT